MSQNCSEAYHHTNADDAVAAVPRLAVLTKMYFSLATSYPNPISGQVMLNNNRAEGVCHSNVPTKSQISPKMVSRQDVPDQEIRQNAIGHSVGSSSERLAQKVGVAVDKGGCACRQGGNFYDLQQHMSLPYLVPSQGKSNSVMLDWPHSSRLFFHVP